MLHNLSVILVRPRFPENIGMAARAMANMGATELVLVRPERWDREKAASLATSQGQALLDSAKREESLADALASCTAAFGATARTGGWRKDMLSPERAAREIRATAREGNRVALVFGSEDRGLDNEEITLCTHGVHIPTIAEHRSLNLAQAVLLLLYECLKADLALPFMRQRGEAYPFALPAKDNGSRRASLAEEGLLMAALRETLMNIDYLPRENPDWFLQPLRRFLRRSRLRRHEFDMLMGICRQIRNRLKKEE